VLHETVTSISTGASLAFPIGRKSAFSATIVGTSRKYTCINWLGRKCVHARPDPSRYRSICSCIHVKRKAFGLNPTPDSAPENLTIWRTPAFLAGVNERALSLNHLRIRGGDHQDSVHAVQGSPERLRPKHVGLHELYSWQHLECRGLRATPDESPHWGLLSGELPDHDRSAQTCGSCHKYHFEPSFLAFFSGSLAQQE
jgi:hypothetical protein